MTRPEFEALRGALEISAGDNILINLTRMPAGPGRSSITGGMEITWILRNVVFVAAHDDLLIFEDEEMLWGVPLGEILQIAKKKNAKSKASLLST